jgi:DNA-directed RNA polymerase specialized sigma24 family protein
LFRVAQGILRDRSHAEDATQQACLDIWRNIQRLRDPAKYEVWSFRLLVHACYAEAKRTPKWLRIEVSDDGVGGADRSRGTGLEGLTDRVAALGGRLVVESQPGRGTHIVAEIPLE